MSQRRPSDILEERKIRSSTVDSGPEVSDEEPCDAPFFRVRRRICSKSYNPEEDLQADIKMIPKPHETKMKLEIVIKENLLFRELEPEQRSTLIDAMTEHNVKAGQILIKNGEETCGFYVIDSGEFEVSEDGKSWKKVDGRTLGELSLIHSTPSEQSVRSVTDGKVYMLDRNNYRRIVTKTNYEIRKRLEELIDQVPELKDLPQLDKVKVTDVLDLMNFSDGDIIVKEGDTPNGMYMVVCGSVKLPDRVVPKGGYFGELPDSKPRTCDRSMSAVACGPTKVAYLDTHVYERLMGPCMAVLKKNSAGKPGKTEEST